MNRLGAGALIESVQGGHVPFTAADQQLYLDQGSYFMYYRLDLAHAQGQPPSAARALHAQMATYARRYPALARQWRVRDASQP